MNILSIFFIRLGFVRMTPRWMKRKRLKNNTDALEFALKYGLYDARQLACQFLGELKAEKSIPLLETALDDSVKLVSYAAMEALESLNPSVFASKIAAKKDAWKKIELERERRASEEKVHFSPNKKERPSKKSYENAKQMLRKPMIGGKWF